MFAECGAQPGNSERMGGKFDHIWEVLDAQVAAGRLPGYVAAIRLDGRAETHAGGRMAVEPQSAPMEKDTLFRIASVTKPVGGALALGLVEDGVLGLDDPIAGWVPEAADPRVLVSPGASLDQTTEARRPITVRSLLTLTSGWGAVLEESPLQQAMLERGIYPGPLPPQMSAEEFMAGLTGLPLAFQPGEGWLYHTGLDVLGVLLSRATGRPLSELLAERVFGPLGMTSTAYWTPHIDCLATAYRPGPHGLEVSDPPDGAHAVPPAFEALGSGLVATCRRRPGLLHRHGGWRRARTDARVSRAHDRRRSHGGTAPAGPAYRRPRCVVGPGHRRRRRGGRALDGCRPLGMDRRDGDERLRRPTAGSVAVLMTQREMTHALDRNDEFWTAVAEAA